MTKTAREAEVTVFKIMADEIEVIDNDQVANFEASAPVKSKKRLAAAEDAVVSPMNGTSINNNGHSGPNGNGVANGSSTTNGNGSNGHHSNGHASPSGMVINRSTVSSMTIGNGASHGHDSNGHHDSQSANGNGANGNGAHSNGSNGNGANGNGSGNNGEYWNGPQRIGRVFAPPVSAAGCVHLHVGEDKATAQTLGRLWNICKNYRGETEVWLHIDNGVEMMQLKVSQSYWVEPTPEFCQEVLSVLGEGCVLAPC
jgi:hypothetical protein